MPVTAIRYFGLELYKFTLAHNEDIVKSWEHELPERYVSKEQYSNVGKDNKFKKKVSKYMTISTDVQHEFNEIFTLYTAGINEVINDIEMPEDGDIDTFITAISDEHASREDFSIVKMILENKENWVNNEETVLGCAKDASNRIYSMLENNIQGQSEKVISVFADKFTQFIKLVAATLSKLCWYNVAKPFNENVLMVILNIIGCPIVFLDELRSAVPVKKVVKTPAKPKATAKTPAKPKATAKTPAKPRASKEEIDDIFDDTIDETSDEEVDGFDDDFDL